MRIEKILKDYNNLEKDSFNKSLKKGDIIKGKVIEKNNDGVVIEVNGKMIKARQETENNLFLGSVNDFEVIENDGKKLILKLTDLSDINLFDGKIEDKLKGMLTNELLNFNLNMSERNLNILLAMHGFKIPISKNNFDDFLNSVINMNKFKIQLDNLIDNLDLNEKINNDLTNDELFAKIEENKENFMKKIENTVFKDMNFKEIKEFYKIFTNNSKFIENIGFLKGNEIEVNPKNMVLNEKIFNGEFNILKESNKFLLNFFDNNDSLNLQKLEFLFSKNEFNEKDLDKFKEIFKLDSEQKIDIRTIKSLKKVISENLKLNENFLKENSEKNIKKHIENFNSFKINTKFDTNELKFIKSFNNENLFYAFIPNEIKKSFDNVELFFKKNPRKDRKESNFIMYLCLNTNNIDMVKTKINLSKDFLKIDIICKNEEFKELFDKNLRLLYINLSKFIDKKIVLNTFIFEEDLKIYELEKIDNLLNISNTGIDAKI